MGGAMSRVTWRIWNDFSKLFHAGWFGRKKRVHWTWRRETKNNPWLTSIFFFLGNRNNITWLSKMYVLLDNLWLIQIWGGNQKKSVGSDQAWSFLNSERKHTYFNCLCLSSAFLWRGTLFSYLIQRFTTSKITFFLAPGTTFDFPNLDLTWTH